MKYKPGDEVLVRGAITDLHEGTDHPYFVAVNYDSVHWVSDDKIISADKTYSDGLSDAWELADKLNNMKLADIVEVFGIDIAREEVFKEISPQEALAKIEAYEKEKEIKVGDVVKYGVCTCVVTVAYTETAEVLFGDGTFGTIVKEKAEKTGKHIDIESLLRQIGE